MKKLLKWILIIVIGLIALGFIAGMLSDDETATNTTDNVSSDNVSSDTEVAETLSVTAGELFDAYQNNEVAADQKYKGKLLQVTGKVSGIDSGIMDQAIVQLATSNEFMPVSAEGDDEFTAQAATLSKGQDVEMICEGAGEAAGFVQLDECVIQ